MNYKGLPLILQYLHFFRFRIYQHLSGCLPVSLKTLLQYCCKSYDGDRNAIFTDRIPKQFFCWCHLVAPAGNRISFVAGQKKKNPGYDLGRRLSITPVCNQGRKTGKLLRSTLPPLWNSFPGQSCLGACMLLPIAVRPKRA